MKTPFDWFFRQSWCYRNGVRKHTKFGEMAFYFRLNRGFGQALLPALRVSFRLGRDYPPRIETFQNLQAVADGSIQPKANAVQPPVFPV